MIDIKKLKRLALDGDLFAVQELINRLEAAEDQWRICNLHVTQLETKLEAAERDAARYRWLRQQESWIPNRSELPPPFCGLVKWIGSAYSENEIDDLIDYAMKETK